VLHGILSIFLFQGDQVRQMDAHTMNIEAQTRAFEEREKSMAPLERKLFEERFNKFIDAIHRFSDEYNKSKGDVWPARQAELVKRAFHDLEQTTSWPKAPAKPEPDGADGGAMKASRN
jgi:hypothetical protein